MRKEWRGFKGTKWTEEVNLRDFIQNNYTAYEGDESFLAGPTDATNTLWGRLQELQKEERAKGGVLDMETEIVSSMTAYGPAYIDENKKDLEKVVGLQTDKPLKRAFMPFGGIKMAEQACTTYGYKPSEKLHEIFTKYCKTHNDGVFDAYTDEMMRVRHNHILTGLPDTYGRGRIVGDYRRVALYGIDFLIEQKEIDKYNCGKRQMSEDIIRLREEISMQIKALKAMKEMAQIYGFDISQPAQNARHGPSLPSGAPCHQKGHGQGEEGPRVEEDPRPHRPSARRKSEGEQGSGQPVQGERRRRHQRVHPEFPEGRRAHIPVRRRIKQVCTERRRQDGKYSTEQVRVFVPARHNRPCSGEQCCACG